MSIEVRVVSRLPELKTFLGVAEQVYENDDAWVAPVGPVNALRMAHSGALSDNDQFRLLLAERAGEPVGCCAVFRDAAHDKHKKESVCFFGYLEAADEAVIHALIARAKKLAREWQADTLRGPRGISRIDARGVLIEGHHIAPVMAGHHPPFYSEALVALGFEKNHDALAYEIEIRNAEGIARELPEKLATKAAAVDIPGLEVRPVDPAHALRDVDMAHVVMVEGFRDVPDNTPLPRALFRAVALPFIGVTNRHMLQIATVNGEPAGFALCVPELNEALLPVRGRVGPGGWVALARGLKGVRTASFKLLGIVPECRGSGLHALLIKHAIEGVRQAGYSRLEASLVDERNKPMRHIVEDAGMTVYRRYRVYDLAL